MSLVHWMCNKCGQHVLLTLPPVHLSPGLTRAQSHSSVPGSRLSESWVLDYQYLLSSLPLGFFLHTLFPLTETMNTTMEIPRCGAGVVAQWFSTCLSVETPPGFHPQKSQLHKILPVSLIYLPEGEFYIIRMVGVAGARETEQ